MGTGRVVKVSTQLSPEEVASLVTPDTVVAAHALRIDHLPAIAGAAGLVLADASLLSHVAIRARELSIPAVGAVPDVLTTLRDDEVVVVDGDTGVLGLNREPTSERNEPTDVATFYDVDRVRTLNDGSRILLYQQVGEEIVHFPENTAPETLERDRVALSVALGIPGGKIRADGNLSWPGTNSPTVVRAQYDAVQAVSRHPGAQALLDRSMANLATSAAARLEQLVKRIDAVAHGHVAECARWEDKFDESGEKASAARAAEHLEASRFISGKLVGIAIVDVAGAAYIRRQAAQADVSELELIGDAVDTVPTAVREVLEVLQRAKNARMAVESSGDRSVLDLMFWFFDRELEDVIAPYRW